MRPREGAEERRVMAGNSRIIVGRNAASATSGHTTNSTPAFPIRRIGGIGIMIRATVKITANGGARKKKML